MAAQGRRAERLKTVRRKLHELGLQWQGEDVCRLLTSYSLQAGNFCRIARENSKESGKESHDVQDREKERKRERESERARACV
jgi:hypothetical protein